MFLEEYCHNKIMKSVSPIHSASSPIPIPYLISYTSKPLRHVSSCHSYNQRCNFNERLSSSSPTNSLRTNISNDKTMQKTNESLSPVLIDFDKENDTVLFQEELYFLNDDTDSCIEDLSESNDKEYSVHLVNGLNVDRKVVETETLYVLCDCPKIKDIANTLSYVILETKKGILVFTDEEHIRILKNHLQHPYYIVKINKNDLIKYTKSVKSSCIVIYNSYTDIETRSSYFLYYDLS